MVSGSESSRETRPRDVPAPVAAWITRSCREALREAERFTLTTVAEKLTAQSSALRENLNSFVEETIATQADVQSARERDRLSALEGVLTKAWQGDIDASVTKATAPLKREIATVTEELKSLRQEISVLKTYRPDPAPVTQDGSATPTPAIAAVKPPASAGAPTTPPRVPCKTPLLEESCLR